MIGHFRQAYENLEVKKMKYLTLILFIQTGFSAVALSDPSQAAAKWTVQCSFGKNKTVFNANSKDGDPYEDDMTMQVRFGSRALVVPIGAGLFQPIVPLKIFPICDQSTGIPIGKNRFIFLFSVNDRPALDKLGALFIDTVSKNILDLSKNLGGFFISGEKKLKLEKVEDGFKAWVAQGWSKNGKTDSAKEVLMGWVVVKAKDHRILARWEKPLPDTHMPYGQPEILPALENR